MTAYTGWVTHWIWGRVWDLDLDLGDCNDGGWDPKWPPAANAKRKGILLRVKLPEATGGYAHLSSG